MADLQDAAVRAGGGDQAIGGFKIRRNGFLNKQVDTRVEQIDADCGVVLRGNDYNCRLDTSRKFGGIGERFATMFLGNGASTVSVLVHHGDKIGAGEATENAGVLLAEGANTNDSKGNRTSGGFVTHGEGSYPSTAILDRFAVSRACSMSRKRVLPASTASAVAFTSRILAKVVGPITGTSKRMS